LLLIIACRNNFFFIVFNLIVEYCNTTNLSVNVNLVKPADEQPAVSDLGTAGGEKTISVPVEKTIESDCKLRVKFVPLEASDYLIDVNSNGVSIEGFPIKLSVFPNKEIYFVNENINGARLGSKVKFRINLNEHKESLNIRVTSKASR
jgi:hypothetical protein